MYKKTSTLSLLIVAGALLLQGAEGDANIFADTPFSTAAMQNVMCITPQFHQCFRTVNGSVVSRNSWLRLYSCKHMFPVPKEQNFKPLPGLPNDRLPANCPLCKKYDYQDYRPAAGLWELEATRKQVKELPRVVREAREREHLMELRNGRIVRDGQPRQMQRNALDRRPDFVVPRPDLEEEADVPVLMQVARNGNLIGMRPLRPQWQPDQENDARFIQEQLQEGNLTPAQRRAYENELRRLQDQVVEQNLEQMGFQMRGHMEARPGAMQRDPNQQVFPINQDEFMHGRALNGHRQAVLRHNRDGPLGGAGRGVPGLMGFR